MTYASHILGITVAVLGASSAWFAITTQHRIRLLEEYAAKLFEEKNVLMLENKTLAQRVDEQFQAAEDFRKMFFAKHQEPDA